MITIPTCLRLSPDTLDRCLQTEALDLLRTAEGEVVLDFSLIPRINTGAARHLEILAAAAYQKGVTLQLRSVNINVYKTLMLLNLVRKFTFSD